MSVRISTNFPPLGSIPLAGVGLMREIGDFATRIIRTRTERMIDVHGNTFAPLSEGYAAQKQKALGHSRPDLVVSGRMLNDMAVLEVTDRSLSIGFTSSGGGGGGGTFIQRSRSLGAADKAFYHNETGAGRSQVKREFFDLNDGEVDQIQSAVLRHLDSVL